MNEQPTLDNALPVSKHKTGKLYVYCKVSNSGMLGRPGEIDLCDGEIVAVRYNRQTGRGALAALAVEPVGRTLFAEMDSLSFNENVSILMDNDEALILVQEASSAVSPRSSSAMLVPYSAGKPGGGAERLPWGGIIAR